jgi:hypothetical protein
MSSERIAIVGIGPRHSADPAGRPDDFLASPCEQAPELDAAFAEFDAAAANAAGARDAVAVARGANATFELLLPAAAVLWGFFPPDRREGRLTHQSLRPSRR